MFKLLKQFFASEDAKGAREASKSSELCSTHSTGATFCIDCGAETKLGSGSARCKECWDDRCGTTSRPRYWVASHWDNYMARHGWKEYPCVKHAVEFCLECTATNKNGVCCE
jgi:hypothetical protein